MKMLEIHVSLSQTHILIEVILWRRYHFYFFKILMAFFLANSIADDVITLIHLKNVFKTFFIILNSLIHREKYFYDRKVGDFLTSEIIYCLAKVSKCITFQG